MRARVGQRDQSLGRAQQLADAVLVEVEEQHREARSRGPPRARGRAAVDRTSPPRSAAISPSVLPTCDRSRAAAPPRARPQASAGSRAIPDGRASSARKVSRKPGIGEQREPRRSGRPRRGTSASRAGRRAMRSRSPGRSRSASAGTRPVEHARPARRPARMPAKTGSQTPLRPGRSRIALKLTAAGRSARASPARKSSSSLAIGKVAGVISTIAATVFGHRKREAVQLRRASLAGSARIVPPRRRVPARARSRARARPRPCPRGRASPCGRSRSSCASRV